MFSYIGPYTMAVVFCIIFMAVGSFLARRGLIGAIFGVVITAAAFGALVSIVFYRGARLPGFDMPIGFAASLVVLFMLGLNMVTRMNQASERGARGQLRDRIPQLDNRALAYGVIGIVCIVVPLSVLLGRVEFTSDASEQGLGIAVQELDGQTGPLLTRIEQFLAR